METAAKSLRYRRSSAITVAAAVAFIGALPMLGAGRAFGLILLVPLAVGVWSWRSGTDVDASGLVVRAALGSRRIPWAQVTELSATPAGGVAVLLTSGTSVTLTAVPASALPTVAAAGGELVAA